MSAETHAALVAAISAHHEDVLTRGVEEWTLIVEQRPLPTRLNVVIYSSTTSQPHTTGILYSALANLDRGEGAIS